MVEGQPPQTYSRWRWLAFSVFVIASVLNYLDRFLLNQLSPLILKDLHFNKTSLGWLLSVTALIYALASLGAGWLLDRWGVNKTIAAAVSWWSAAGLCTGFVRSFSGLLTARSFLAAGESTGIPAVSKVNALYLKPHERALGTAVNGLGLSLGLAAAPLFVKLALRCSWRQPFIITGLLSFVWIPLWLIVSRRFPPGRTESVTRTGDTANPIDMRNLWLLIVTNMLWMGAYNLWSNWTTFYYLGVYHLTLAQSARYSWIPPLVSNVGGLFGGWLSRSQILRGRQPIAARQRAVWISAAAGLLTLLLPLTHHPAVGTALISWSFFFALAGSVNVYAAAIDAFGAAKTGTAVAAMTCAYGVLQAVTSPYIGYLADLGFYQQPVIFVTLTLVLSAATLSLIQPSQVEPGASAY